MLYDPARILCFFGTEESFVKPTTQLLIMQNHDDHAGGREDCLIISSVSQTYYNVTKTINPSIFWF